MSRLTGPHPVSRTTDGETGRWIYIYVDQACTQLADILTYSDVSATIPGSAVAGSRLTLDYGGVVPKFWFPDGVSVVWGRLSRGGPTYRLVADSSGAVSAAGIPDSAGVFAPFMRMPKWQVASSIITQFQAGHGWGGSTGAVLNDTSDFVMGSQSAKMPTPGDGLTYAISKIGLSVDTTGQQIRLRVKLDGLARINNMSFIIGNDTGYTNAYTWNLAQASDVIGSYITDGEWVTTTLNFASATTSGSPTRTGIVAMKLTVRDNAAGAGNGVTAHIQSVELVAEPSSTWPNGLVSICFDDGWGSFWTLAKPKLDAVGFRASHYLIGDLVDQSGKMTTAQLLTMQEQGHEICAHAWTNADHTATYTGLTAAQLDADIRSQVANLRSNGFRGMGSAYPQGQFGQTSDGQSTIPYSRRYFAYTRTTYPRTVETFPPADPQRLRARSAIGSFAGAYPASSITATTTGDLDRAKASHAWLILTFHKIVTTTPIAGTECLQSDFNAVIDGIVSRGMDCMPIGDVLRYYG